MSHGIIKYALTGYDAGVAPSRMGTLVSLYDHLASVDAARAEIERLTARAEKAEAENQRLREALKKIASTGRCEFAEVRAVLRSTEVSHD